VDKVVVDLGVSPLSNRFLEPSDLERMEPFYPLRVRVCEACWLVQLPAMVAPEHIFSDYAYFSSYSDSWLAHCSAFAAMACERFRLGTRQQVVELASNDGYLLQYFASHGVSILGVEPAANVAKVANEKGIPTRVQFFGRQEAALMVAEGIRADLLVGNNVLAHVPDLNDFIAGVKLLLAPGGVISMEFPHVEKLMELNQFDTIYHEHFSYFSLFSVDRAFHRQELEVFDVEELSTHGGSLRIFGKHAGDVSHPESTRLKTLRDQEASRGVARLDTYSAFARQVEETRADLLLFLIDARRSGKQVAGYGAPAKGNTLLNYCGVRPDLLPYTVDRSLYKQGKFLPGTRIPVHGPQELDRTQPDFLLILPWNLKDEVIDQMAHIRRWGGKFVIPIPRVEIIQ